MKTYCPSSIGKICWVVLLVGLIGCDPQVDYFEQRVAEVTKGKEEIDVIISIAELTNFSWDYVCFEKEYSGGARWKFFSQGEQPVLEFYSDRHHVGDAYEPDSPSRKCYPPEAPLTVRKYKDPKDQKDFFWFYDHNRGYLFQRLKELTKRKENDEVPLTKLTNFSWDRVCFEDGYSPIQGENVLELRFFSKGEETVVVFSPLVYVKRQNVTEAEKRGNLLKGRCYPSEAPLVYRSNDEGDGFVDKNMERNH